MLKIGVAAFLCSTLLLTFRAPTQRTEGRALAVKFTSVYTDLNRECKDAFKAGKDDAGSDMPLRCKGYGGYYIYISYSAMASQVSVQMQGRDEASISLGMQPLNYSDEKGRKIEWRMADGRPFAVIARVSNYSDEAASSGDLFDPKYKTGESLIVKGLKGYEKIDFQVDVKSTPNPNERARQLADENYQK